MIRMAHKLNARGVRVFRMDMRGHGAGLRLAWSPGHAGRSEDAAAAVARIAQLCPGSPIAVAGISLGGNILLKWLGEAGATAHPQVDRALAVSPPIELLHCCRLIRRARSRLYDRAFVKELLQQVAARRRHWPALAQLDLRQPPRTLLEFDDRVTAPLSGFRDAEHYYATASAGSKLATIAVPTLILTAADDPLVPPDIFLAAERSEFVSLRITQHGGHVGFIGRGGVDADRRWLDWRVVDWATHEWK
jgi:predicted alpha/beta-fold hydrolase